MSEKELKKYCSCVSEVVARRLTLYLRCFIQLKEEGYDFVSSKELAERFNLNSDLIRKDFSYFGTFGKRGVGYNVDEIIEKIKMILGLQRVYNVAIAGAGNLGKALAHYPKFNEGSFRIVAMFDSNARKVGRTFGDNKIPIFHIKELPEKVKELKVDMGIIAVPARAAQQVADAFVNAGVKGLMNFAPARISVPDNVKTVCADFRALLEMLAYYVSNLQDNE